MRAWQKTMQRLSSTHYYFLFTLISCDIRPREARWVQIKVERECERVEISILKERQKLRDQRYKSQSEKKWSNEQKDEGVNVDCSTRSVQSGKNVYLIFLDQTCRNLKTIECDKRWETSRTMECERKQRAEMRTMNSFERFVSETENIVWILWFIISQWRYLKVGVIIL